jgi:hypothetical protein
MAPLFLLPFLPCKRRAVNVALPRTLEEVPVAYVDKSGQRRGAGLGWAEVKGQSETLNVGARHGGLGAGWTVSIFESRY